MVQQQTYAIMETVKKVRARKKLNITGWKNVLDANSKAQKCMSIGGCRKYFINAITWVLITVTLNHSPSLSASESHPNNLDKACEFITNPIFDNNKIDNEGPNIIVDSFGEKVAELNFKPSRINWKLAVLSLLEGQGSPIAQVRAVPPCRIISARQFGTTSDGDE